MRMKIVILSGNHACHNPRAFKEAEALAQVGYDVHLLGGWLNSELADRDQQLIVGRKWMFTPVVDWTSKTSRSRWQKQWTRMRRWIGSQKFRWLGWQSDSQLGYSSRALLAATRRFDADLYIAHSEPALWVAEQLSREGHRVGVDMEDWFSEDLLPEDRMTRPLRLLRRLESAILNKGAFATCPSPAMSSGLSVEYSCRPPAVVYNAFPWDDRLALDGLLKDRAFHDSLSNTSANSDRDNGGMDKALGKTRDLRVPSIHWYSQTLGEGRGLEDLFAALPYIQFPVEIHLRGKLTKKFENKILPSLLPNWRNRVFIHSLVSNEELLSRISEHDIGFAGELKYCRNKDLTVSNKILHYMLAGLAIIASDTKGQMEVASSAGSAVEIYPAGEPKKLAEKLNWLLGSQERLKAAKDAAIKAAQNRFCWERQVPHLLQCVERGLAV